MALWSSWNRNLRIVLMQTKAKRKSFKRMALCRGKPRLSGEGSPSASGIGDGAGQLAQLARAKHRGQRIHELIEACARRQGPREELKFLPDGRVRPACAYRLAINQPWENFYRRHPEPAARGVQALFAVLGAGFRVMHHTLAALALASPNRMRTRLDQHGP